MREFIFERDNTNYWNGKEIGQAISAGVVTLRSLP